MLQIFPSLKKDIGVIFGIYDYTVIATNIFDCCAPSLLSLLRIFSFSNSILVYIFSLLFYCFPPVFNVSTHMEFIFLESTEMKYSFKKIIS